MKILTLKDPHINVSHTNRHRVDYGKDIETKWSFINDYCEQKQVSCIVATGDVLERNMSKDWSFKAYTRVRNFMYNHVKQLIYTNVGNHDYLDGKYKDTKDTVFDQLCRDGSLSNISGKRTEYIQGVGIYGINYDHELNEVLDALNEVYEKILEEKKSGRIKSAVLISHTTIIPREKLTPILKDSVHLTYEFLATNYPMIDVHVLGHYHKPEEITRIKDTTFVSPRNMLRMVRDSDVMTDQFQPQFGILEFDDGKFVKAEYVDIPFVPYQEAFKIGISDEINASEARETIALDFDIDDFKNNNLTDTELLDIIIKDRELSPEIKDLYDQYYIK